MSTRPIPAKRKSAPKIGAVKEIYGMAAMEGFIEEGRVNNGTMTEQAG